MKNKKEPLSIITVKTLLAVIIFTGLGTIIFGGAYLIGKQGVISLPHYQPSDKSECKIDSDCWLVYVDDYVCLPWDTSLEKYKCLNLDEAKIFGGKKIDPNVMCSIPDVKFDRYICKCANGKCEKVKEELVEEVSITTDKMEYGRGETVEITVKNNLNEEQKIIFPSYIVERLIKDIWVDVKGILCPCGAYCKELMKDITLQEYEIIKEKCYQKGSIWSSTETLSDQAPSGEYRIKIIFRDSDGNKKETIYSNEFTIKEKTALDPRCGEKVVGIIPCRGSSAGYEFDLIEKKCVRKAIAEYCSVETPFKTLEECQRVCEKKENIILPNINELIKCSDDSDCVLISSSCCSCSMGGGVTCINKKYLEDWNQKLRLYCKNGMDCPAVYLCDDNPTGCECVNNVCQGTGGLNYLPKTDN